MADFRDLALEIIKSTRAISDSTEVAPGRPFNVALIPGLNPQAPTNFNLTGTLAGTLSAVVDPVKIAVKYSVQDKNGMAVSFKAVPSLANPTDFSEANPLSVGFLLKPQIVDDTEFVEPSGYQIVIDLRVNIDGVIVHTGPDNPPDTPANPTTIGPLPSITVPVLMPALGMPAIFLLSASTNNFNTGPNGVNLYAGDDPDRLLVMIKASSPLRTLDAVVATMNRLMGTLITLEDVLGWVNPNGSAFGTVIDNLSIAVNAMNTVPVIFFCVGNAPDLGVFGGGVFDTFDDQPRASLLIGATGTQVSLFSQEGFSKGTGGISDNEYVTFTANDIGSALGISTGIGCDIKTKFSGLSWDTDTDSIDEAVESVRFGGMP